MVFSFGTGLIVLLAMLVVFAVRVLREYQRGVVFQLGRFWAVKGPGLFFLIPVVDKMVKVGLRTVTMDVPPQDVITRDNVSMKVNAVIFFRVLDPAEGGHPGGGLSLRRPPSSRRPRCGACWASTSWTTSSPSGRRSTRSCRRSSTSTPTPWGVKVVAVEVKNVDLPQDMQRAMAKQAEAERERRAKVINAEGEFQAAEKLLGAAEVLSRRGEAMQLRYLQTLSNIATDKANTIVFPVPMDCSAAS